MKARAFPLMLEAGRHAFTFDGCKDLNDYHKSRGTGQRAWWAHFFREHFTAGLRRQKRRKPKAATPL